MGCGECCSFKYYFFLADCCPFSADAPDGSAAHSVETAAAAPKMSQDEISSQLKDFEADASSADATSVQVRCSVLQRGAVCCSVLQCAICLLSRCDECIGMKQSKSEI